MFLKRFREKIHKKHINSELRRREILKPKTPVQRVGIIVNSEECFNLDWNTELSSLFPMAKPKIDIILFSEASKKNETAEAVIYNASDIGWNGTIKNEELKTFIDTKFSLLISYYTTNHTLLRLLTASSKAAFKVGLLKEDQRLNDLIIHTELPAFTTFNTELIKYLKILKRL
ncbi:hypothetical protein ES676_03535 [Bizionia saleffrena]|uniref:Uncharacterized protein n=1 Tax=Bizionia saleffrena TaxID=291189 RepID=A0A8H2LNU2_9FLAO|nr:hypothetical protein [Bizionia saleffrena]TYB77377.1 hypothetical protein ES676_03535 [Bizionia saleffrena]